MPSAVEARALFQFVPTDRPERFAEAFGAGADAVILDPEDAVAPDGGMVDAPVRLRAAAVLRGAVPNEAESGR